MDLASIGFLNVEDCPSTKFKLAENVGSKCATYKNALLA